MGTQGWIIKVTRESESRVVTDLLGMPHYSYLLLYRCLFSIIPRLDDDRVRLVSQSSELINKSKDVPRHIDSRLLGQK